eukprot:scaffold2989_cov184-Amphora_coffeaeformis.AAC.6
MLAGKTLRYTPVGLAWGTNGGSHGMGYWILVYIGISGTSACSIQCAGTWILGHSFLSDEEDATTHKPSWTVRHN